jgi:Zn-dependent alcohol dehydrogenase
VIIQGAVLEECGRPDPFSACRPPTIGPVELDGPGPDEVRVEIEGAGVCHSDPSVVNGDRPRPVIMLLGHEASGRIVELGPGVDDLRLGQKVVIVFLPRCGTCEACHAGGRRLCAAATTAQASISPLPLVAESRTIIGSFLGSGVPAVDVPEYGALWEAGQLPVERLVSAYLDLDDVNQAMDDLAAGRAMRQVIKL